MSRVVLVLGGIVVFFRFLLSLRRLLNCLIVVEKFNVLLLLSAVSRQWSDFHIFFISLMVIFTVEVVLGLVVLTRL